VSFPPVSPDRKDIVIEAHDLSKRFKARGRPLWIEAVTSLDLTIRRGETFGLLGADGAGKTTTLRLLNGLLVPEKGQVRVAGFDVVRESRSVHLCAGYMPQQFALYGDMSVAENLAFFAEAYGLTVVQRAERIPRLMQFAQLWEFQGRLAAKLSGGMKKKLALACMLVHEPDILFLDEPTLGVDPVSRREFWSLMSDLRAERGLTIFVCTPYMDEAERCTRVGLLHQGRLIACDNPESIKKMVPGNLLELRPSSLYLARDVLQGLRGVLEVQTFGDRLHVFVDDVDERTPQLETALASQGIGCSGVRRIEPGMEEAFVSLVRSQSRLLGTEQVPT
jgi:ABC-2 type transport system ATP-binding protein